MRNGACGARPGNPHRSSASWTATGRIPQASYPPRPPLSYSFERGTFIMPTGSTQTPSGTSQPSGQSSAANTSSQPRAAPIQTPTSAAGSSFVYPVRSLLAGVQAKGVTQRRACEILLSRWLRSQTDYRCTRPSSRRSNIKYTSLRRATLANEIRTISRCVFKRLFDSRWSVFTGNTGPRNCLLTSI